MHSHIQFFKSQIQFRFSNKASIIKWIDMIIQKEGRKTGTITFVFCSDSFLLNINKKYLSHDFYTDIITFDYSEGEFISGEIYISIDRVTENAASMGVMFHVELSRIIIHGVLHLLGYSDRTANLKKQMSKKEDACLSLLHIL